MSNKKTKALKRPEQVPFWEWIIAGIGLVLVLGVLSLSIYRGLTEELTPPRLTVEVISTAPAGDGFVVEFRVTNSGNTTAGGLVVEGKLMDGTRDVETSTSALTYVPANAERTGGLFFSKDPKEFSLEIRPLGYEAP